MMLRDVASGEFFDFNSIVEVDKRVKLFEEIDETLGDFSYSFVLPPTSKNLRMVGFPLPDVKDKRIYREVESDLVDNNGILLYKGLLRVEKISRVQIQCSFFSGNYNWISLLSGPLSDLDLSDLVTDLTRDEIVASAQNTEGIIFPLIDAGGLITRSFRSLMIEDFTGMIFVKTLFKRIFQSVGIKTDGDLFTNPEFDSLLLAKSTLGKEDIDSLSSYVKQDVDLVETTPATTNDSYKIPFDNDFDSPFFDGSLNPFDITLNRYTAIIKEKVIIEASIIAEKSPLFLQTRAWGSVFKNGVNIYEKELTLVPVWTTAIKTVVSLEQGDYIEIFLLVNNGEGVPVPVTVYHNSTVTITPTFIYRTKGSDLVPNWTKGQLVKNILELFCCVSDYSPATKTLTIDFFEGIKDKEAIDLSEFIEIDETDYVEFISSFGKKSLLNYEQADLDSVKQYNLANIFNYPSGEIAVNNDFLKDSENIIDSEFKSPITYVNQTFGASLERTEFIELEEREQQDFPTVVDDAGQARFDVADSSIYTVGELVRVTESTNSSYDGDYIIDTVGPTWIKLLYVFYDTDATGKITKLLHRIGSDDGVYLFLNTKYQTNNVHRYSNAANYYIGGLNYTDIAYAFFNILDTGVQINTIYKQGLSFGEIDSTLMYQRTLKDKYWGVVSRVLNDPVKILGTGYFNKILFAELTPLRPIRIRSTTTNNLYYYNLIRGYKGSEFPCYIELIKLS